MKLLDNGFLKANQEDNKTYLEVLRSGVIILPINSEGKLLFFNKQRKGDSDVSLELPKGFLLTNETAQKGAVRQLTEYTNLKSQSEMGIGYLLPVTGFLASDFKVFVIKIKDYQKVSIKQKSNIKSHIFADPKEVLELIAKSQLKCSLSISAFARAYSLNMFEVID